MSDYTATATRARSSVARKGAPVTFRLDSPGTLDESTGRYSNPTSITVSGWMVGMDSDPVKYQALNLIPTDAITGFFTPATYGQMPPLGSSVTWGGIVWTVKSVEPLAPNGIAIGGEVIAQGPGGLGVPVGV